MSTSSSVGSGSSSVSNSPPGSQQMEMPAPPSQIGIEQILFPLAMNPLDPPSMAPQSAASAPFQLLEALAKTGLLSQLNAMKQAEIVHLNGAAPFGGEHPQMQLTHQNAHNKAEEDGQRNGQQNPTMAGGQQHQRKRRRMIGNLDNTLDGLVAKRADQTPMKRRYQSETEAIELPDDEVEIKRMEADPDVCTRMCSVCGYQGKWVSEMIRHKRVHTNDRPFKCKYCNRTSKWKADLIRHVAKTHGIRVVSKYSRSKAFEMGNKKHQQNVGTAEGGGHGEEEEEEEGELVMLADDVIVLGGEDGGQGEGGGSSAASDCGSGHSSQDENNNHIVAMGGALGLGKGGNAGKKIDPPLNASECSLNSLFRKAQRLNNMNRANGGSTMEGGGGNPPKIGQQQKSGPPSLPTSPPFCLPSAPPLGALPAPFNPTQSLLNLLGGAGIGHPPNLLLGDFVAAQQKKAAAMELAAGANVYKCGQCPFEEVSFPVLVSHLHAAHRIAPFICQVCSRSFNELVTAGEHFSGQCSPLALKSNFVMKTAASSAAAKLDLKQFPHFPPSASNLLAKLATAPVPTSMAPFSAASQLAACLFPGALFPSSGGPLPFPIQPFTSSAQTTTIPAGQQSSSAGPNCGSPVSILSTAPSFDSLHSMLNEERRQTEIGKIEGNEAMGGDAGKANSLPNEVEIPSADSQMDGQSETKEGIVPPSKGMPMNLGGAILDLKSAIRQMAEQNNSPMLIPRGASAFKPVNPSIGQQPQSQQQLNCASLAAFGQFLAELQRSTKS